MRQALRYPFLPATLAALLGATALAANAAGVPPQIYQQRAADGRIVLTDRPSATAVTERTWQVEREDPAAARQRAEDVRRQADAVSERVQRRIEAQERLVASEQERAWQAQRDMMLARAGEDSYPAGYAYGYGTSSSNRFWYERKPPFFEVGQHPRRPGHHGPRKGRFNSPGSRGSR